MWNKLSSFIQIKVLILSLIPFQVIAQNNSYFFIPNDVAGDYANCTVDDTWGAEQNLEPTAGMTLEFWVQQSFVETPDNFVSIVNYMTLAGAANESGFAFMYYNGLWRFMLCATGETDIWGSGLENWPGLELEFDEWVHVACTYDGASVKIYKNGLIVDTCNMGGGAIQWVDIDKKLDIGKGIGYGGSPGDYYFEGAIDEVRVWSLARNQTEIQGTMNQVIEPLVGLEAYWNFNDDQSIIVQDQTGNGYQGTLFELGNGFWFDDVFAGGEETGACCDDENNDCEITTEAACGDNGGTYLGNGTDCTGDPCASGPCFDLEITEADFPYSHLADLTTEDDDWDQSTFTYLGGGSHENGANGADYTYKLTLTEPAVIYVTTCDELTNVDVQIGIYTEDCNEASWVFFQDDSNTPIYYPDETSETFDFSCISGFESAPQYANMLPNIEWDAGTYYIVVDDRAGTPGAGSVKTWMGYSLLVDSTSTSGDFEEVSYFFSEGVFGGEYSDVYNGNGIGLESSDYSVVINPNGGNANEANLTSLESVNGGGLVGGEEIIVLNLEYPNIPSGGEILTVGPASVSSIFNSVGVPLLDINGISISLVDVLAPTITTSNPSNNATNVATVSNIAVAFSEVVQNSIDGLSITNSNASDCFLLEESISGEDIPFAITSGDQIGFVINPDGQLPESTQIILKILSNIEDVNENGFSSTNITFITADESPPLIQSSSISSINDYVEIVFNEGVYSTNSGSGGLELSDLNYTFNTNGGNCDNLSLWGITSNSGSALTGGETSIRALISLGGSPSGVETIALYPANNSSIFDASGNPMSIGEISDDVTLLASALLISSSLADSNVYIDFGFSVGIYGNNSLPLNLSGFEVTLEPNGGNASIVTLLSITDLANNPLVGGEESIRIFMSFNELPSGEETVTFSPASDFSIYSVSEIPIPSIETYGPYSLFDEQPPVGDYNMEDGAIDVNQSDSLMLIFSEDLYNLQTGELVTVADLVVFITLKFDDNNGGDIPFTLSIDGSPPTLIVNPIEPFPSESVIYYSFNVTLADILADINDNSDIYNFNATFTIQDYLAPMVDSSALDSNNSYLDLIFDEEIYGTNQEAGAIQETVIQIEFFNNGSVTDTVSITSLTRTDSNFLIGGEQFIRVNLEYNSTPGGDETMVVSVNNGVAIFDNSGNQMMAQTLTDTIQLYDILPPGIEMISVPIDSFIILMKNTPITFSFNEKIDSLQFTVTAAVADSVNFQSSQMDSSLKIILEPPFTSFDSITVYFSYIEDEANLSTVDIAYTYTTPMLGDYNLDSTISFYDLDTLVNRWKGKDYNFELAPVTGTAPHFISTPDSKFDIEDGMAFVRMWSWYQKKFGEITKDTVAVGRPLNMVQRDENLYIMIDDSIAAGQIQFAYEPGDSPIQFGKMTYGESRITLTNHRPEKGYSILEFARSNVGIKDTFLIKLKSEIKEIGIYYQLMNDKKIVVRKGTINVNSSQLPSEVALYPAYPNPFNPVTTIAFDVPENIQGVVSLQIFDITGRRVATLVDGRLLPGKYRMKWHAHKIASGMYFARLIVGAKIKTQKIILLK